MLQDLLLVFANHWIGLEPGILTERPVILITRRIPILLIVDSLQASRTSRVRRQQLLLMLLFVVDIPGDAIIFRLLSVLGGGLNDNIVDSLVAIFQSTQCGSGIGIFGVRIPNHEFFLILLFGLSGLLSARIRCCSNHWGD